MCFAEKYLPICFVERIYGAGPLRNGAAALLGGFARPNERVIQAVSDRP